MRNGHQRHLPCAKGMAGSRGRLLELRDRSGVRETGRRRDTRSLVPSGGRDQTRPRSHRRTIRLHPGYRLLPRRRADATGFVRRGSRRPGRAGSGLDDLRVGPGRTPSLAASDARAPDTKTLRRDLRTRSDRAREGASRGRVVHTQAEGRDTTKEAPPPSWSSTHAWPPLSSAKRRTSDRPIPSPEAVSACPRR